MPGPESTLLFDGDGFSRALGERHREGNMWVVWSDLEPPSHPARCWGWIVAPAGGGAVRAVANPLPFVDRDFAGASRMNFDRSSLRSSSSLANNVTSTGCRTLRSAMASFWPDGPAVPSTAATLPFRIAGSATSSTG